MNLVAFRRRITDGFVMKQKNILLAIETSRGFGRGLIRGISQYALEQGNWSLLFQDRGMTEAPQQWLKHWKGDGIISRSATLGSWEFLQRFKIPHVELLGDEKTIFGEIVLDNVLIGEMAVRYFTERNYRQLAFFSPENWWWSVERRNGFLRAAEQEQCRCDVFLPPRSGKHPATYSSPNIWEIVGPRVIRWLKSLSKPVGLFVISDLHAVYILEACKRSGIAVPEEIAILGMDNDPLFCSTCSPQLSSIDPNTPLMGYEAAKRLDSLFRGSFSRERIRIPPAFVADRQSTESTAVDDPQIIPILKHIRENAVTIVSVSSMAKQFGMSTRTLQRKFKETMRCSPEDEIHRIRLERAKMLLVNTKVSIAEISRLSGFSDSAYFARFFHQKIGMTPKQYRKSFNFIGNFIEAPR